jgi:hypothetical protein
LREGCNFAVEFSRCAARLIEHGRIEQQRHSPDEGRFLWSYPHAPAFATRGSR